MRKYILSIYTVAALCIGSVAVTSCSEPDDINDLVLSRVLSPTGITARLSQDVNIIVNWNEMSGATSYEVEVYADNNDYDQRTPDATYITTLPQITLTSLIGETNYYIRVRALDDEDSSRASKWVEIMRTTNPEQQMNEPKTADIQSTTVALSWKAGIEASTIVCTPTAAGSTAPTVTYTLTSTDLSSGTATVSGLAPETTYKATLKLGQKTRGYATFTTYLDLSDATELSPNDDWVTTIQNAAAGSKFALKAGNYSLPAAKLQINSNIVLAAQSPAAIPTINTCIHVNGGASLGLYMLTLDGTGTDGSQAIEYKTAGTFGDLIINGCEMKNYTKGLIYINVAAIPNTIQIENCIIHDIQCNGGDFIDSRKGGWNNLLISKSTFYNCASSRDIIRADDASASVTATVATSINQCTFYNVGNGDAAFRFFYVRFKNNSNTFTNNVVVNFNNKRGFANSTSTGKPTYSNNYYYNCKNLTILAEGNTDTTVTHFDAEGKVLDKNPFANPDNGDFTITDELFQSYGFGDPRWR